MKKEMLKIRINQKYFNDGIRKCKNENRDVKEFTDKFFGFLANGIEIANNLKNNQKGIYK